MVHTKLVEGIIPQVFMQACLFLFCSKSRLKRHDVKNRVLNRIVRAEKDRVAKTG
jgi:hypothetical protein